MKSRTQLGLLSAASGLLAWAGVRAAREARRIDFEDRVVLITGGSRGLGLFLARELALEGARLALVAREGEELDRAHDDLRRRGADVGVFPCDVRDRNAVEMTVDRVIQRFNRLDVLINDAGVIQVGPWEHMRLEDFEEAMKVHFWGPLYMILAALPFLRRQDRPRIVNVSSIGGKIAVPHLLPYSASKFALTGLSDGLRAELARENIRVTTVCPGLMRTGSPLNAWFKGQHRGEFTWFALFDALPLVSIDARRAARKIIDACRYGDAELTITPQARLAIIADAVLPSAFAMGMSIFNRLLPGPTRDMDGDQARSGWQSPSRWAPSLLTRLSDRATAQNNELPQSA
jgi:NAD(P)-dependent dehydrogenase (short-subunit alcohol dehydrogenase family)